ncbi:hypothetical protein DPMN_113583 [Dreissena polymorpha]|uniref:Uncharacterized protein n=1 Tax=Dreissena polymorpha TaxID=45954 RepID=A0A9D4KIM5_DREPO|nr:hypothetical protein DPMN_113583 [Dreissena polymorpha]
MVAICTHDLIQVRLAQVEDVPGQVLGSTQARVLPVTDPTPRLLIPQVCTSLLCSTYNLPSKILKTCVFS